MPSGKYNKNKLENNMIAVIYIYWYVIVAELLEYERIVIKLYEKITNCQ